MNVITILNNKFAKIDLEDEKLFKELNKLLSYKEAGVEYTQMYQNGYWNGIVYLLNKKREFAIGLLDKVKQFLSDNNVIYEVIDKRKLPEGLNPLDISKKLVKLNKIPRYYQINAVKEALNHRQGIIRVATGGGKTQIAAILTAALNKPTNIYVIGLDLLSQFHKLYSDIFDEEIGYIGNGVCDIRRINIISLWTASRALDKKIKAIIDDEGDKEKFNETDTFKIQNVIKSAKVHIIDECHTCTTASFKLLYKHMEPEYLYGMSGTPMREDGCDLLTIGYLGNIVVNISASELIEKNYLVKPTIKFYYIPKQYIESRTYQSIYKEFIIENSFRNKLIIGSTKKLVDNGYITLVLYRYINHGKKLYEMAQEENIDCELLSGNDALEKREAIKERILSGDLKCIIMSTIGDIGLDIINLNALVLAGGGKSSIKTLQRIGRVLRPAPGKTEVKVIDFWDDAMFLKNHSKRRLGIYKGENGFEVIDPPLIKK